MRDKDIWKGLAILVVFVMIGSCGIMPSAGNVSESDMKSSSAALYVLEDAGYNTTIRADNISGGGICQVLFDPLSPSVSDPFSPSVTPFPRSYIPRRVATTILDHTMCEDVTKYLYPIGRTTRFYTDDKAAFCWFEVKGSDLLLFTMEWYDPYDRLYAKNIGVDTNLEFESATLEGAGSINISGYPAANMPGNWYVKLYHKGFFDEENTLLFTEHFTIFPRLPGLVITDIWWSGSTIYYKIKNQGPENAGASYTSLSVDEVFKSSDYVAPLGPGAERTENFSYNWAFTPPEDKIVVCADYLNDVTEIDETNNCGSTIYTDIQSKINAANPGDTIIIKDGIYNANIKVNKRLTIRSENGSANCIVQALNPKAPIFEVSADYVNISGFTVKESYNGIYLNNADYCNISNNNCYNSGGIFLRSSRENIITGNNVSNNDDDGIFLGSSSNNTITGNNVSNNNGNGIELSSSSNNAITGNNVSNNNWDGIELDDSSNNAITGNNVGNNNGNGIELDDSSNNAITGNNVSNNNGNGIELDDSSNNNTITGNVFVNDGLSVYSTYQNIVEDNKVNGKPLVYLEDVSDYKVEDAGQVIIVNCNNITIENLDLSNTSDGIALWKTENSKISNNTVCNNNRYGIRLWDSSNNNTITGNNVSNNNGDGIRLWDSSNNNTIIGNKVSSNNGDGIFLRSSRENIITGNNVSNNDDDGIGLVGSSNNTITGNNASNNNEEGIRLHSSRNNFITGNNVSNNNGNGIYLYASSNNTLTSNIANNNDNDGIYLWLSSNNNTITGNKVSSNNGDGIRLSLSSNNNTITGNTASSNNYNGICLKSSRENIITGNNASNNNGNGICLWDSSSNNTITGNNVSSNGCGIKLYRSRNNFITGNNVSNNDDDGICLDYSSNNKIYLNNFINNALNVDSSKSTNIWNSTEEITYTYSGTAYTNYVGNYWDDYSGIDADEDGIGDNPYLIASDKDIYPLMEPQELYCLSLFTITR